MDYKELLKKYWFVGVIAIVLCVFVGIYVSDSIKNQELTVQSKQVGDKYVAYSVDGEDVYADDFFNSLYEENGENCALIAFQRAVLDGAYETTDEMSTIASNYAAYMYQYYGEDYILSNLKQMGYVNGVDDLTQYYIDSQKRDLLISDYVKLHADEIMPSFKEESKPRIIYHILVKVADITQQTNDDGTTINVANPTEEEKAKLDSILEALKTQSFEEVAKQYSDDSSAQTGGYIGCISENNKGNYDETFANTSMQLENDQVSDVIVSQFGYHIIWNAGDSNELLVNDAEFMQELENSQPILGVKAIMEKADSLGYEIVDETLKAEIQSELESEAE